MKKNRIEVVRIQSGSLKELEFKGTAFFVNPDTLITAKHVIKDIGNKKIFIDGVPDKGTYLIESENISTHPKYDVAVLRTSRKFEEIKAVTFCSQEKIKEHQAIRLSGFYRNSFPLYSFSTEISSHAAANNAWKCQSSAKKGMSGGPVEIDGEIAGLIIRRDDEKILSYFHPSSIILKFLNQLGIELSYPVTKIYGLVPYLSKENVITPKLLNDAISLLKSNETDMIGFHGDVPGVGKTFLATYLVNDKRIRQEFPDGIFWVNLSQSADITNIQSILLEDLHSPITIITDPEKGASLLRQQFNDKKVLLILDNAWNMEHIKYFNVLQNNSKTIITTRQTRLLNGANIQNLRIPLLTEKQSLELLRKKTHREELPEEAKSIAKECGHLPLALCMIGALLRTKPNNRWGGILSSLRNSNIDAIEQPLIEYQDDNLTKAFSVSVDYLEAILKELYIKLAIFPEDTPIPESVIEIYWKNEDKGKAQSIEFIDSLIESSLLMPFSSEGETGKIGDIVKMHNLLRIYLQEQCANIKECHQQLISNFKSSFPNGWHTISYEKPWYFHNNFLHHFIKAGKAKEAKSVVLNLLFNQPMLNWKNVEIYADYSKVSLEIVAKKLILFNKNPKTLTFLLKQLYEEDARIYSKQLITDFHDQQLTCTCLKLLPDEETQKQEALRLLECHNDSYVLLACLEILATFPTEKTKVISTAQSLLKKSKHPHLLRKCLELLEIEDAEKEAKRLIHENMHPVVLVQCLRILKDKVDKTHVKKLLFNDPTPLLQNRCLHLLGEEASGFAQKKLKSKNWNSLSQFEQTGILRVPINDRIRKKRAVEILDEWKHYQRRLVAAALTAFDESPNQAIDYCREILNRWYSEMLYYRTNNKQTYAGHIIKAMSNPQLHSLALQKAREMIQKDRVDPTFLDDLLKKRAREIIEGIRLPWYE